MHRTTRLMALLSSLTLMLVVCALASDNSSTKSSVTKTATKTSADSTSTTKTAATHPASMPAQQSRVLASAEDLTGTITTVNASSKEVTLVGSNGVPYDFDLTGKTNIELSNQKLTQNELANETYKQATVRFVPTSRGNIAKSIQITS
jgi:hypothetical protein